MAERERGGRDTVHLEILALCDCGWKHRATFVADAQQAAAAHRALALSDACATVILVKTDAPESEVLKHLKGDAS
jgi:hypothetical protein